eukprot:341303-Amphidinium_carterae.2
MPAKAVKVTAKQVTEFLHKLGMFSLIAQLSTKRMAINAIVDKQMSHTPWLKCPHVHFCPLQCLSNVLLPQYDTEWLNKWTHCREENQDSSMQLHSHAYPEKQTQSRADSRPRFLRKHSISGRALAVSCGCQWFHSGLTISVGGMCPMLGLSDNDYKTSTKG